MACMYVDGLLLLQTTIYFTIVATGLATSVASSMAKDDFGGNCVLYGGATCAETTSGFECQKYDFGRTSVCSFITAANVFVCVFYALANACYHAYAVHRSRVIIRVASQMWLRTLLFGSILAFTITLVAACAVTVGLSTWCGNLHVDSSALTTNEPTTTVLTTTVSTTTSSTTLSTNGSSTTSEVISSTSSPNFYNPECLETQTRKWFFNANGTSSAGENFGPNNYYYSFSVAESSCWVNVAMWLLQIIFYIRRLIKSYHQRQQNTYQDPFTTDDAFDVFN